MEQAGTSGTNRPFPEMRDLTESIKEVECRPVAKDEAFTPPSLLTVCKKRKHPCMHRGGDGLGSMWMSKSFTAASSSACLSGHTRNSSAVLDDIALLPRIRHRKRLSLASRTASSASSGSSCVSHSSSLDRVALKRLQDSRRFKRKRSSSLSCIESGSPTPLKQPLHDDLTRSVSFKADEIDGCRAFAPYDLDVHELLGRGFFGEVFKVSHRTTGETMVLKRLYRIDPKHERTFLKEAAVMRQLDHPNVLKFLGILYKEKQLHLITEFVSGGSLKRVLEESLTPLSWCRRTGIAKDIAAGMAYLHSMNIIHRDLNSGNVLIREECGSAVVADFGLARLVSRRKASRRRRYTVVGNPYWMAPEMLRECNYDERVDLFSFGITLCEIIGRCTADPDVLPRTADFGLHQDRFVHEFCTDCPQPLFQIAFRCASIDPDLRPPFSVLYDWLDLLKLDLEDTEESDGTAPSTPNTEALSRQILMYEPSPTLPAPSETTPLRSTIRCKKVPSAPRRKISLDLGYEEASSVTSSSVQPPSRCVSADPCCCSGEAGHVTSLAAQRQLNTLFSSSESALDSPAASVLTETGMMTGGQPTGSDWEVLKYARMDVDEQDSAISSHNSSGGSYFS